MLATFHGVQKFPHEFLVTSVSILLRDMRGVFLKDFVVCLFTRGGVLGLGKDAWVGQFGLRYYLLVEGAK